MSNITDRVISSWNLGAPKPTITGDPSKTRFEIRGFQCGENTITRSGDEPISMDDPHSTSLVHRALAAFGTASPWTAVY